MNSILENRLAVFDLFVKLIHNQYKSPFKKMKTEIENKILVQIKNIKQNFQFVKMYKNDEFVPYYL